MNKYKKLKEYVNASELRVYKNTINIKLSKELAKKYDDGIYDNYLNSLLNCYLEINSLGIKYPGNSNPNLYIYIVPDENYLELLQTPSHFAKGRGSGKPVPCYALDGFKSAYGISQGLCENYSENIFRKVNNIHELCHLLHGEFQQNESFISEGIAEVIPLYVMGYEDEWLEHKDAILNLDDSQIISPQELINSEKNLTFGSEAVLPNRGCSFRYSYISSYLLIRGFLEKIGERESLSKAESLMFLLKLLRESQNSNEWLVEYLADSIGLDSNEILYTINLQKEAINSIRISKNKKV